jgi:hypothetical protein
MARGAFWTIIVDDQPTAFRAPVREDLLPTLAQLQRQHPSALIKWFQRGRLWETPGDAMDAGKPPGRGSGWRPGGAHKDPRDQYKVPRDVKRARWASQAAEGRGPWVKGDSPFNAERGARRSPESETGRTPGAPRPRGEGGPNAEGRPAWKPKSDRPTGDRPAWKPKGDAGRTPAAPKPRGEGGRADWRGDRPGRDTTPRAGGQAASPAKKTRTWRAGELPPADRKRKKSDD